MKKTLEIYLKLDYTSQVIKKYIIATIKQFYFTYFEHPHIYVWLLLIMNWLFLLYII